MKYLGSKTIETERLILKAQTMAEQHRLWEILMIPEVNKYYLTIPKKHADKLNDWNIQKKFYQKDIAQATAKDIFKWSVFLKENGDCIGRVSCHEAKIENGDITDPDIRGVGWYLDPAYQGQGYGYEAAKAMMDYMFNECEIKEILTGAAIQNPSSWKIMEKYGFIKSNKTKMVEYTFVDEPVETYQYFLTKEVKKSK